MKKKLTSIQRFWQLLKPDKSEIWNIYIYAIFSGLVYLTLPLGIQAIVNLIQGGKISTSWIILVIFVIVAVAAHGILQVFQLRITENLQQKIFTRAAFEFGYRIPRIRMEELYRHYAPELMNRFFDTLSVQKGLSKILIDFSTATLQVAFGLILLSLYHPFFIAFSLILIIVLYVIFRFTWRRGLETSLSESKYKYQVAHWLEEVARTSTTFKLAGKTDLPLQKVDAHTGNYLKSREKHFKILIQQYSLMIAFKVLIVAGLLILGGILVMNQDMNIGQFVAAEIIILLIINSVEKLILSFETIYDVMTALEKIGQVTDLELEPVHGKDPSPEIEVSIEVDLKNIGFAYPGEKNGIIKDVSLKIHAGEKMVLTGPNGSGKSTLLHLIAGLYDVQNGRISYNGLPKDNVNMEMLRSAIGDYLSQEQLFEGTVLENITMGRRDATFENVKSVIENLGLTEFIRDLSNGYDTILDPQGKKLPRSVIEKLLIARSVSDNPKLLLVEDTFMYLEEQERNRIIEYITHTSRPWTLVAITTDPVFMKQCDRVAYMQEGTIVKSGHYEEIKHLLKRQRISTDA